MARNVPGVRSSDASVWEPTEAGSHLRGRKIQNTKPEVALRRAVHATGLRFRLNRRIGRYTPDFVLPRHRVAVFVDGCFWHGCPVHGPKQFRGPNAARWAAKIDANRARDRAANDAVTAAGWLVVRIWECDTRVDINSAAQRVKGAVQAVSAGASTRV